MNQTNTCQQGSLNLEPRIRAAQYVRMSTDLQQNSTLNQADKIREYADKHNIEIVRTYEDDGKSGLNINGRPSLQQLLKDVQSNNIDFNLILVYDISRWGRFQDADESAYYEYTCRQAGIEIIYCAEQFANDGTFFSTTMKSFKRTMAGEYSRELSNKVFIGQCRLIQMGFRQGGTAGFGLRRALITHDGKTISLKMGQHKSFQMDRVILIPGPEEEIEIVHQIYDWFINQSLSEKHIAYRLNEKGIKTDFNRAWTRDTVHEILTNPKYIGHNVFNRTSNKLKKIHIRNPQEQWIRKDNAFEAIVPVDIFYTAQGIIRERSRRYTEQELLEQLKLLYQKHGYLSGLIINESDDVPTTSVYSNRFGSLLRAYELVGFTPKRDYQYLKVNKFLRRLHPEITQQAIEEMTKLKGIIHKDPLTDLIFINDEISISLVLTRSHQLSSGNYRWKVRFDTTLNPDITVVVRLNQTNTAVKDYYLLPRLDFMQEKISLGEFNPIELDSYRFDNLNFLYGMAEHVKWRLIA
ncbi:recombinase family protein [Acinetobacter beijerinckii]|uniref:Recombinase domain-containing protein n=1 Tax=Acinetobacter genomosp. 15BJ TaxID=106651 RepID=R9B2V7_9GAMM|nr:recombinase family protein [Acinetobacter genomosp. 15BJ]EOR08819.1 hypothetical protein F896_01349 [Acinetobacter genomosp. 15BJ]